ncbi:lytic transglycosylase domain-containing protein [Sphingomonas sp.]|uniref:lytic transglycosylase domain-containing protein n=1 Tax=Sphingomonas sp. TaxID=28214 RepID=UPI001B15060F|nr:lytic transglycosylase domain-containing protein [Sphingomonas sp.]MBO9713917.1 lytic transglycosylase domain-containing protein [Sphingomonas sp.]
MGVTSVNQTASIQSAIAFASRRTGVDFNYLLGQAQVESGLRSDAAAPTSSARGLYQFIDQSWLGVIKAHGADYGLGWAAGSIRQTPSGRYVVSDPAVRRQILGLRSDPNVSALMAAEHASDNKDALEASLGRATSGTDLYMAHFLGLGGARRFLTAMDRNPGASAASLFPAAANANRSVFYAEGGQPRSLQQVYDRLGGKLDAGAAAAGGTGSATGTPASDAPDWNAMLGEGGEVVLGSGASADGDATWLHTTLANLNTLRESVNPMRPTPETARLAYLMLASLGA